MKVERFDRNLVNPNPGCLEEPDGDYYWIVTDQAGTRYYFGTPPGADNGATLAYIKVTSEGTKWRHRVYKLYKVEDVHGNLMEVTYTWSTAAAVCGVAPISQSYLSSIKYTKNSTVGDTIHEYQIDFETSHKGYTILGSGQYGDAHYRLDAIRVYYNAPGQQSIRKFSFSYDTNATDKWTNLIGIQISDNAASSPQSLPAMNFTYRLVNVKIRLNNQNLLYPRWFLDTARNGYGGVVDFDYIAETWSGNQLFQIVQRRTLTDTISGVIGANTYGYAGYNMNLAGNGEQSFGRFQGFSQADEADPAGNISRHYYNNTTDHILNGYELSSWHYGPDGTTLYDVSLPSWTDVGYPGWPAEVRFVYLSSQNSYHCEGKATDGSNNTAYLTGCLRQRQEFSYDIQYGQKLQRQDYQADGTTIYRTVTWGFVSNLSLWLFKTSFENVFQGGTVSPATRQSSTLYTYDNHPAFNTPLGTKGELTGVRRWVVTSGSDTYVDVTYTYDDYGNVQTEKTYTDVGSPTAYATAGPRTTTYTYAQGLVVTRTVNALNQALNATFDYRWQKPLTETGLNNEVTKYRYDSLGRLISSTLTLDTGTATYLAVYPASGATFSSASPYREQLRQHLGGGTFINTYVFYTGLGRKLQHQGQGDTSSSFILTNFQYDNLGRLIKAGVPYAGSGTMGAFQTATWGNGATATTYDPLSRPLVVTAPDGTASQFSYRLDTNGSSYGFTNTNKRQRAVLDANGHLKHYVEDEFGRLIRSREFSGAATPYSLYGETKYSYDVRDNLLNVADAATTSNETDLTYDWLGRKTTLIDPDLGAWSYLYDVNSNLTRQTDAGGQRTCFYYDALNRATAKHFRSDDVCPSSQPAASTTTIVYTYDTGTNGKGHRTRMTDLGGTVDYSYDARGRLTSETRNFTGAYAGLNQSGGYATSYGYNNADQIVSTTYPDTEVVSSPTLDTDYTRRGLPKRLLTSLSGSEYVLAAGYNALGQMTSRTVDSTPAADLVTSYGYDTGPQGNNRLRQMQVGSLLTFNYRYDGIGNIMHLGDPVRSETQRFSYDAVDQLLSTKLLGTTTTFQDPFDSKNATNWVWTSHQAVVNDAGNNLIRNTGTGTDYNANFYRSSYSLTSGEGLTVRFRVSTGNPSAILAIEANDATPRRFGINIDANKIYVQYNNGAGWVYPADLISTLQLNTWYVLRLEVHDDQQGFYVEVYQENTPSVVGRFRYPMVNGKSWRFRAWVYRNTADLDAYTEFSESLTNLQSFTYNNIHNITNFAGTTLTYNAASPTTGCMADTPASKPHAARQLGSNPLYTYDCDGNMTGRTEGGIAYTQGWNAENRLATVTWPSNSVSYVYDGDGQRLLKTQNSVTTLYIGNHFEKTGSTITKYYYFNGERVAMRKAGIVYYLFSDHLSTASLTTDLNNVAAAQSRHYPYGQIRWSSGTAQTDYDFTGQRKETFGLLDYNARYYDPLIGRFISADTLVPDPSKPQAFDRYGYAYNNPIRYNDPTGHCPICDIEGIFREAWNYGYHQVTKEPPRMLFKAAYHHYLPEKFIDQYIDEKGDMNLTYEDMVNIAVDVDVKDSEKFASELNSLTQAGGGVKHIQFSSLDVAKTQGTLGTFTINYEGDLTVAMDADGNVNWQFDGRMNFYDEWNFEKRQEGERSSYGERVTTIARNFLPGQPFKIQSRDVSITQNNESEYADWGGANRPGVNSYLGDIRWVYFQERSFIAQLR